MAQDRWLTCSTCKARNPLTAKFCGQCFELFKTEEPKPEEQDVVVNETPSVESGGVSSDPQGGSKTHSTGTMPASATPEQADSQVEQSGTQSLSTSGSQSGQFTFGQSGSEEHTAGQQGSASQSGVSTSGSQSGLSTSVNQSGQETSGDEDGQSASVPKESASQTSLTDDQILAALSQGSSSRFSIRSLFGSKNQSVTNPMRVQVEFRPEAHLGNDENTFGTKDGQPIWTCGTCQSTHSIDTILCAACGRGMVQETSKPLEQPLSYYKKRELIFPGIGIAAAKSPINGYSKTVMAVLWLLIIISYLSSLRGILLSTPYVAGLMALWVFGQRDIEALYHRRPMFLDGSRFLYFVVIVFLASILIGGLTFTQ